MANTAVYTYLCYTVGLYIESGLQVFYFVMAIYGWISWNKTTNKDQKIIRWPLKYHVLNIGVSALVTYLLGYLMVTYTDQQNPYLDAFSDRKSTRLNSSHVRISYAVFCLKKKKKN